jgi:hypothetical protein
MKKLLICLVMVMITGAAGAQINMTVSNPLVLPVLLGNYDPALYTPPVIINNPDSILHGIVNRCSKDSLVKYLEKIDSYYNRNSGSDTVRETHGIGAVQAACFLDGLGRECLRAVPSPQCIRCFAGTGYHQ